MRNKKASRVIDFVMSCVCEFEFDCEIEKKIKIAKRVRRV